MAIVEKQPEQPQKPDEQKVKPLQKPEIRLVDEKAVPEPMPSSQQAGKTEESSARALIKKFAGELLGKQGRLIKAVVSGDVNHILKPTEEAGLTADDIKKFIEMAMEKPGEILTKERRIIGGITRGIDDHKDDWAWEGPRAKYQIASANLNKKANETFGTQIQVPEHWLSKDALKAHFQQKKSV